MKKILSTALIAIVLSTAIVDTVNAARGTRPAVRAGGRRRGGRGLSNLRNNSKKVQAAINIVKATDNPVMQQKAKETANEAAERILADLGDVRTWSGDILGKYTPEQKANAVTKYTELEVTRNDLMDAINGKQAYLDSMSTKSMIFWTKAEGGKEQEHKIASQELAEMKATLKNVNKAMRDQAVIAGKEACATIRMAVSALTAASVAGLAYGIDKYGEYGYTAAIQEELTPIGEEGRLGMLQRQSKRLYGATTSTIASLYNRLPDVPYFGAKARNAIETLEALNNQLAALIEQQATIEDQNSPAFTKSEETIQNLKAKIEKAKKDAEAKVLVEEKEDQKKGE